MMEELTDLQIVKLQEQDADAIEIASHEDALEFFDKIMRDPRQPIQRRMRAAEMKAQYKYPKLSAVATTNVDGSFADQLDRLIMQRTGKLIEHRPDEGEKDEGKSPAPLPAQAHWPTRRSAKSRRF
jgi:hypothetical protein